MLIFLSNTKTLGLPNGLLESICYVETKHNVAAIARQDGGSDSYGICQVKMSAARHMGFKGNEKQLMEPEVNIHYAAKLLQYQIKRYSNVPKAVTAYNKGHSDGTGYSTYYFKVKKEWSKYE